MTRSLMADIHAALARIADALERQAPPPPAATDHSAADAFLYQGETGKLAPVTAIARTDLGLLHGIDRQAQTLLANTRRFAQGLPANNALLWGARGMGKSSLVKAVHGQVAADQRDAGAAAPALVEIHREDIAALPRLLAELRRSSRHFIVFCDDLSFDGGDVSYKSLKAALEGGLEGRPGNVVFYATSNRRHLMPRDMIENERAASIHGGEASDEKISLSDRFGLWLGFHHCNQATYLAMVEGYATYYKLPIAAEDLHQQALEWAHQRGGRSGRVAWQFIQDLAGRLGVRLAD